METKENKDFQNELMWIKMDWFTENNADIQIDRIKELYENNWIELHWKTYWQIWEEATWEKL